MDSKAEYTA